MDTIKRQKKEHSVWQHQMNLLTDKSFIRKMKSKGYPKKQIEETIDIMGQWKYLFSSKKGNVSMIKIREYCPSRWVWEIYAYENPKLFSDCLRFKTKKQAEKVIRRYLS